MPMIAISAWGFNQVDIAGAARAKNLPPSRGTDRHSTNQHETAFGDRAKHRFQGRNAFVDYG